MSPNSWYLIQIKTNSYKISERNLNKQGFATFVPMQQITIRKNTNFKIKNKPLFPGYMFVSTKQDSAPWQKINGTTGVKRIICMGTKPLVVSPEIIANLKLNCNNEDIFFSPKIFSEGDEVIVLEGPFTNFIATVEKYEADQRIWLLMDLMGRKTKIQTSSEALKLSY